VVTGCFDVCFEIDVVVDIFVVLELLAEVTFVEVDDTFFSFAELKRTTATNKETNKISNNLTPNALIQTLDKP
jgi:hypothetical protein